MAGDLQEGARQGFAGGRLQGRIGAALLLLLLHGPDEPLGYIALGGGPNAGLLLQRAELQLLLQLFKPPTEAVEHLTSLLAHMGQLAIGEARQIGHEHLAVVAQGQVGRADAAASGIGIARTLRAVGGHRSGGTAATGDAGRADGSRTGTSGDGAERSGARRSSSGHTDPEPMNDGSYGINRSATSGGRLWHGRGGCRRAER